MGLGECLVLSDDKGLRLVLRDDPFQGLVVMAAWERRDHVFADNSGEGQSWQRCLAEVNVALGLNVRQLRLQNAWLSLCRLRVDLLILMHGGS